MPLPATTRYKGAIWIRPIGSSFARLRNPKWHLSDTWEKYSLPPGSDVYGPYYCGCSVKLGTPYELYAGFQPPTPDICKTCLRIHAKWFITVSDEELLRHAFHDLSSKEGTDG